MSASQLSVPVRPLLGCVPAPAVKQKAAPALEYSPAPVHAAQLVEPPIPYFPASQALHTVFVVVVQAVAISFPEEQAVQVVQLG